MIKRNIVAAQLKFFRHEGHYEFLIIVQDLLNRFPGVKATVIRYFDSFVLLIEKEGRLVDTSKK
ncbi:MAG: hypothetical protein LBT50_01515, partial [Prevotellaceae bacterium]|nr:hypothetical protein [Prevotellaceae bacterium]